MKPIKMFGLAVSAALMAMTFAGTTSAMASSTQLCANDEAPCASPLTHLHAATETKAKLLAGSLTIECDVLFLGEIGALAAPQIIEGNFTYTNCGSNCSVTEENGPSALTLLRTGHETASLALEWLVHAICGSHNCRYIGEGLEGIAKGALLAAELEKPFGEGTLEKESGLFCPGNY